MSSCRQEHSQNAVSTVASAIGGAVHHFLDSSQVFFLKGRHVRGIPKSFFFF